jgi:hypothetical protein
MLLVVPCAIFHQRAAQIPICETPCSSQVGDAIAYVCLGSSEIDLIASKTHHGGRCWTDLHQAHLSNFPDFFGAIAALDVGHRVGDSDWEIISSRFRANQTNICHSARRSAHSQRFRGLVVVSAWLTFVTLLLTCNGRDPARAEERQHLRNVLGTARNSRWRTWLRHTMRRRDQQYKNAATGQKTAIRPQTRTKDSAIIIRCQTHGTPPARTVGQRNSVRQAWLKCGKFRVEIVLHKIWLMILREIRARAFKSETSNFVVPGCEKGCE